MATAPFQLWIEMAPVASAVRVGSTVTITTSSSHGFTTGADIQVESITGSAGTSMVGVFPITVTSGTTFTYTAAGTAGTGIVTAAAISYDLFNPIIDYAAANRQGALYAIPESVQMSATGDGSGASLSFSVAQDVTPSTGPWFTLIPDEARVRLVKANTGTTPAADKSDLLFISSVRGITARLNGAGVGTIADIDLVDPTAHLDRILCYGDASNRRFIAIGGAVRSSNVVTITTTSLHGRSVGDPFRTMGINGGNGTSFNTNGKVASVPSTTTFTFNQTGSNSTGNTTVVPTAGTIASNRQSVTYTVPSNHGFLAGDVVKISGASHSNPNVLLLLNGYTRVSVAGATQIQVRLPAQPATVTGTFDLTNAVITPNAMMSDGIVTASWKRTSIRAGDTDATTVNKILNGVLQYKSTDYALSRIVNFADTSKVVGTTGTVARVQTQSPTDTVRSLLDLVCETYNALDNKPRRYWVNAAGQICFQVVDTTAKPAHADAPYKIITSGAGSPNTITTAATLAPFALTASYDHQTVKAVVVSVPNPAADSDDIYRRTYTEAGYTARANAPEFEELLDAPSAVTATSNVSDVIQTAASQYFLERREPVLSVELTLAGAGTASHNNLGFNAGYAFLNLGTVSSASRTGSTVTVTMATAHGLASGAQVILANITGSAGTSMNGTATVTVTSGSAFTYTSAGTAGSGTVTAATAFGAKLVNKWEPGQWVDIAAPEIGLNGIYRVERVDMAFEPGSFTQRITLTINRTPTRTLSAILKKRGV